MNNMPDLPYLMGTDLAHLTAYIIIVTFTLALLKVLLAHDPPQPPET